MEYPYVIRMPNYLGKAIKAARRSKNMTQKDLANVTGTSVKFICDVERGKETVQVDKVFDLLRALSLQVYVTDKPLKEEGPSEKTFDFLG
jgi:transcriptional regulator with XRE-family HTH domain